MEFIKFDEMEYRMVKYLKEDVTLLNIGHECCSKYYKFMHGNCTDITGYPYMGKTLWLMEMLFNLSESKGIKHLLHLPDSGKPEEVMATLIQKTTGKTFDKRYPNKITETEIRTNLQWIDHHFKILAKTKDKKGKLVRPTPKQYWDFSTEIDVHTASIDSWNYMNHESSGHEYLADVLSYRNELAEISKMHFYTIIHPKNTDISCYDKNGRLKAPDVYRLMGGSEWNNNGKNIISIHKEEKESGEYYVYFQKIKPRLVGKTGYEILNYDIPKQKFWFAENGKRVYSGGKTENFEIIKPDGGMKKNYMDLDFDQESGDVSHGVRDVNGKIVPF